MSVTITIFGETAAEARKELFDFSRGAVEDSKPVNPMSAPADISASGIRGNAPSNSVTLAAAPTSVPLAGQTAPAANVPPVYQQPQPPINPTPAPGGSAPAGWNSTNPSYPSNSTPAPTYPPQAPAPVYQQPAPVIVPPAPIAPAQVFTYEQVGTAGAALVGADPSKMGSAMALLQRYGVKEVTELKPEQLAPFALELRAMGAKI